MEVKDCRKRETSTHTLIVLPFAFRGVNRGKTNSLDVTLGKVRQLDLFSVT